MKTLKGWVNNLKNLNDIIDGSIKILKKMEKNDNICLIHHDDADGCCSAALFSIICEKLTGSYPFLFPIRGMNNVGNRLISKLKTLNPEFVFVLDVTVDPETLNIFKGFVLDHHIFNNIKQRRDMPYFNPRIFEKDDKKIPPTSCMMYKILKKIFPDWTVPSGKVNFSPAFRSPARMIFSRGMPK